MQAIREMLGPKPPDLVVRQLELDTGAGGNRAAALVYLGGLVNAALLGENVIQPLLRDLSRIDPPEPKADFIGFLEHRVLTVPETRRETLLDTAVSGILRGDCALFVDGCRESLVLSVREYETRPIQEPTLETVIRGPKEGFTENLDTNLTLLRRRLPDPRLRLQEMYLGRYSRSRVVVAHVEGLANAEMVREVWTRLSRIEIDGVIDSGLPGTVDRGQPVFDIPHHRQH